MLAGKSSTERLLNNKFVESTPQKRYGTPTTHPRTADPEEDQIPDLNRYSFLDQNFNYLKDKQVAVKRNGNDLLFFLKKKKKCCRIGQE